MKSYEIARLFEQMADVLELQSGNPFRIRAYRRGVHILGHPTGRLLGEREPYALDLDEVLRAARRHGKALEINAYPDRLDLCDTHARRARDLGVLLALGTDTHMLDHLAYMELGVATARRGWVEAPRIVNSWPLEKLRHWRQPAR